jgi:hypothetical protein
MTNVGRGVEEHRVLWKTCRKQSLGKPGHRWGKIIQPPSKKNVKSYLLVINNA